MAKVGILYDNISGNTGDVAIGLSVKKILRDIGVEFDELVPGNFNPNDYETIIIGGGHLIRPSPDFFYDKFKVPGKHVLNAIGILDSPDDLHYLNDYKYVTVRSSWDKERLSYLEQDVHVIPCTTMLLEDLEDFSLTPKSPSLGIHLLPNIFNEDEEKQFVDWVSSLPFTVYLIPITHYNRDYIYLGHLSSKIKNSVLLPLMKPLEIFTFIGKLDYFIGCSLHGGIFSYVHNVPFILFNYNEKMFFFMKDRGLQQYTFTNYQGIRASFDSILSDSPDYSEKISKDLDLLKHHVQYLKQILPSGGLSRERSTDNSVQTNHQIHLLQSQARGHETRLRQYETNTFTLIGQLQETNHILSDRDNQIDALNGRLQELLNQERAMEEAVAERDSQIAADIEHIQQANSHITTLENEIAQMQKSVVWQITMGFHNNFIERVLPNGSRRRGWYDLGLKGTRILVTQGPRQVLFQFRGHKRAQENKKLLENNKSIKKDETNNICKQFIDDLFDIPNKTSSEYVPLTQNFINLTEKDIKLIAFYLPQFHPIPENDRWWGKGFTDWTNVSKALPQFVGHYQPHLPDELGFYDLRLLEVQKRQIELAKQYGIYGFCFHYYWFNGKRLLEGPLDQFLDNQNLNFPFCICWANENWTRRWDGLENEILIAQTHSSDNDIAFIKGLESFFKDPRYIRINSRPVLIVYRAQILPDARATLDRWRTYCKEKGIGELYLIAAQTFGFKDPRAYGFDAAVEFPPHTMPGCNYISDKIDIINPKFSGQIWDYDDFVESKQYLEKVPYKLFKAVTLGWDNTARRPNDASIFHGANPQNYKKWLIEVAEWTKQVNRPQEQIIFINAWNEWAEGTHLEPDRRYGYGYLQATSEGILDYRKNSIK